ncbi:MAG: alpha/beta hydrolase [Candidatus Paceibacteria bacterium]
MKRIPDALKGVTGPHQEAELFALEEVSKKALILLHGRGGSAEDIVSLYNSLETAVYTLIPEAVGNSWYPQRFVVPQIENQPALDSALQVVTTLVHYLESMGIKKENIVLAGFSQGACLVAEYLKHYPTKYSAAVLMSGGFIGSDDEVSTMSAKASLQATPVYIGCDRNDFHIPLERVEVTARGLEQAGAEVCLELFGNYGHRPHPTALQFLQKYLQY